MYPKALLIAFLSVSLGVNAHNKGQSASSVAADTCATGAAVKTVTVTQTASAAASSSTAILAANPNAGKGTGKGGNNAGAAGNAAGNKGTGAATGAAGNKGNTGAATGSKGNTGAATGNKGNTGAATTTAAAAATSAAAAATSAAAAAGKGGNNAAATGNAAGNKGNTGNGNANAGGNAQTSLTIDPSNIFTFTQTGQEVPTAGQEASLTSTNNFINFCLQFPDKPKTNGQQITDGSCNQTPMGVIAAQSKMPSAKFQSPANGATIPANTNFDIQLAINNLETGHFTNPTTTFHMAPQVVNAQGLIKGHSHVTIEQLTSLDQKTPTDPTKFVFFKGLNDVAKNGILTTTVDGGLPAGTYRIATINSSANHQPALVAVAQRGALDDMVYFTVSANGAATGGNAGAAGAKGANGQAAAGAKGANGQAAAAPASTAAAAGATGAAAGKNGQTAAKGNKNAAAAAAAAGNRKTGAKNRRRF
ncbi:hypothetical protein OH76DRAFT_1033067 [Lentinus brumalis]|uniref:Ribosomal protein s17 n=1 Tax=Lentinus brumalis TaxID=2498619 RepID=A0A371CXH0_9APHY|nr:hypothetical protein OH76DRAFT_1033067 [Polyporus brumalis]